MATMPSTRHGWVVMLLVGDGRQQHCLIDNYYLDLEDKAVVVMSGVGAPNIVESGRCAGHPMLHSDEIASCWPTRCRG
uniref:Uncharacterized protein n=1 Tax=Oryza barthii TaxID=65489 RepID=A0A0D3GLD1_9ORYZ